VAETSSHYRVQMASIDFLGIQFENVISISTGASKSRIGVDLFKYGKATFNFKKKKFYFECAENLVDLQEKVWPFSPTVKNEELVVGIVWDDELSTSLKFGTRIIKINDLDSLSMDICELLVKASPLTNHDELNIIVKDDFKNERKIKLESYYLDPNVVKP